MKKFLFLFGFLTFTALGFVSCSGDDDSSDVVNDRIYGTWESDYKVVGGQHTAFTTCGEKVEYNFSNNGTYSLQTFTGEDVDNCLEDTQSSGRWEYLGNDNYLIHLNSVTINDGNRDQYTYHLEFPRSDEMQWRTLADFNSGANTFTVFRK